MIKRIHCLLIVFILAVFTAQSGMSACASGQPEQETLPVLKTSLPGEEVNTVTAPSYILTEMQTGTVLFEKNADEKFCSAHFNKLMTLLLLAERIKGGKVKSSDVFAATDKANAQKDPQIWLDRGEKITVDELIKAVTVGNANDAAVTIAENVCGSEEKFVAAMNEKAKKLGMNSTVYKDSTGVSKDNSTTPRDLSKLCSELRKYDYLTPYMKTWLITVRNGKAELVNSNRLVRNYSGITGMKAISSKDSGSCGCITAIKGKMELCAVVVGCSDNDKRDSDVKKLLKSGAESYQMYSPSVPQELLKNIPVTGGESLECKVMLENVPLVVIKRGTAGELEEKTETVSMLKAPVKKGAVCATYSLEYKKNPVCTVNIVAKHNIEKMNWLCGVKKLLYNLIKL